MANTLSIGREQLLAECLHPELLHRSRHHGEAAGHELRPGVVRLLRVHLAGVGGHDGRGVDKGEDELPERHRPSFRNHA